MVRVDIKNDRQCLVDVQLGDDVKIFNFVNAYGCSIDSGTKVGALLKYKKGQLSAKTVKFQATHLFAKGCTLPTMFLWAIM